MEFPPDPPLWRLSKVADVNPETCGIDEQMDWPACGKPAEGEVEDHADRERSLDGQVRVRTLSTRFPAGRSPPGIERIIGKPDGQVTTIP